MGRSPVRVAAAAGLATLAIVAAGCGGSSSAASSPPSTTTTTTGSGARSANRAAFDACLAQHGVKLPGRPPGGGNGGPPAGGAGGGGGGLANLTAAQRQAFTACRSKLPAGAFPGRGGGGPRANASNPAFAKYTACLKQHGVTLGATNNQTAFAKASAACAKYRPAAPGGGATTTP
jgi:hypothetical protein